MITNERQYKITKSQYAKLAQALSNLNVNEKAGHLGSEILAKAERDALISEIEVLESQIKEYESLRSGIRTPLTVGSLGELPQLLVRARIMQRLTQKELANLAGVKEQQIQRYESEGYRTASLAKLQTIADILKISVTKINATVGNISTGGQDKFYLKDAESRAHRVADGQTKIGWERKKSDPDVEREKNGR